MIMTMTTFTKYMWVIDPKVLYSLYTDNSKIIDITQLLLEMPLNAINPTVICDKVISNIKLIGDYRL
jgi:hypothetical protein